MSAGADRIHLATSHLACTFEAETGFLRKIMLGSTEIVRAIYAAVRDENWNTVEPNLGIRNVRTGADEFVVQFDVHCEAPGISFFWEGSIEAQGPKLTFAFAGMARSSFRKNRIGFCILHPVFECAGLPCSILTTEDAWVDTSFPREISPHQPFKNLRALRWSPRPNVVAELSFAGDVFETEDQRNWTDASFKTYCTPLSEPYPVLIGDGARVHQQVVLRVQQAEPSHRIEQTWHTLDLTDVVSELAVPPIGLGVASHDESPPAKQLDLLRQLQLQHLRVDLRLSDPLWSARYLAAAEQAKAVGSMLLTAVFVSANAHQELRGFSQTIDRSLVKTCLIFHEKEIATSATWLVLARELLGGLQIVGGTNAYFAELNRHRPPPGFSAAYSINPQVHAFDDRSLMETLEAQAATVASARHFCAEPLVISPITLRPRFNPNATSNIVEPAHLLPSAVDLRQRTLVGAAWTAASFAALLPCDGIASLTYFETTGWRGLMETASGPPLPAQFASQPSDVFPVYYVFAFVAGATTVLRLRRPLVDGFSALALRDGSGAHRYLLANLDTDRKNCTCRLPERRGMLRVLEPARLDELRRGVLPDADAWSSPDRLLHLDFPGMSVAQLEVGTGAA